MKRSAKFNEKAMKKKLLSQTQCGAPVSTLYKCPKLTSRPHVDVLYEVDMLSAVMSSTKRQNIFNDAQ